MAQAGPGAPSSAPFADVLRASGQVGADLAAVDWTATPLGFPERWPRSLSAVVQLMLGSRFAMWMAWGPELTFFCNDAYRRDTLGAKYPWALGRPAREVWAEIWPDIGPRIDHVLTTGEATWDEGLLLFLERSGFREETYHTFSYSPLHDGADVRGMLCVVAEETERVVGARHVATLRELGAATSAVRSEAELLRAAASVLEADGRSLPFTLTYLPDAEEDGDARPAGTSGVPAGHPLASMPASAWAADGLRAGAPVLVDDLAARFGDLPSGAWDAPPTSALLVPLAQQAQERPVGFLVAGLNPFRPLDAAQQGMAELVAGQLAAVVASARAFEDERRRAEELAELDRAKTAFFTNVSHELRTPLTLLLGPAEDALADTAEPLPPAQRARTELVVRNGRRLLGLVNELLDFSRLEAGHAHARFVPVDLAALTEELAATFEAATARAGLALDVRCAPLGERAYVDPELWAKVVLNLLSNALKFTFEGGITVELDRDGDLARLRVRDSGIGIGDEDQGRLFERFHRVQGARSRTHEGTGVGLALVDELARLHGGDVGVRSTEGEGSTFTVTLPLGREHLPAEQVHEEADVHLAGVAEAGGYVDEALGWLVDDRLRPEEERPAAAGGPPALARDRRPRVLVADDNADMRAYIAALLAEHYDVRTAVDGEEALELARRDPPDLVLTDVMMPRLDGFGLLAALQEDPATTDVPVVMVSARGGEEGTVEGLRAGADDYLVKPFSARELEARVRANVELDRLRRTRDELQRNREVAGLAQRLARLGSWERDLRTDAVTPTAELLDLLGVTSEQFVRWTVEDTLEQLVHPDDRAHVREALAGPLREGGRVGYDARVRRPDGVELRVRMRGEVLLDEDGTPAVLRASLQDVTDQHRAGRAFAAAAAAREAAAREHQIADKLQRSLLPPSAADLAHLEIAAAHRAASAGTSVGGDWYDVIPLGDGRTALVMGDVMGRGIDAAAVMGQLRAATRAYALLDLPPHELLTHLDRLVDGLHGDQIATCAYVVHDPEARSLTWASAGHLPVIVRLPDGGHRLAEATGPPLGSGLGAGASRTMDLPDGAVVALYTDGLVERRGQDVIEAVEVLAEVLGRVEGPLRGVPDRLVTLLPPDDHDDDVAVMLARVTGAAGAAPTAAHRLPGDVSAAGRARAALAADLAGWGVEDAELAAAAALLVSELVSNAVLHGEPPLELRLRLLPDHLLVDVLDGGAAEPRPRQAASDDEHGRGLALVDALAERWGVQPTSSGKSTWCLLRRA